MTEQDRKLAEEIYFDLCDRFITTVSREQIVFMAMQAYHEAKLAKMADIDTYELRELLNDLNYNIETNLQNGIDNVHVTYLRNLWNKLSNEINETRNNECDRFWIWHYCTLQKRRCIKFN